MRAGILTIALLALVACGGWNHNEGTLESNEGASRSGGNGPLLPSLQATTLGDTVYLVLQVTNTTEAPVELRFRSGQSYDFMVLDGEREIWRWSSEMMFTQALRQESIAAGETLRFEERWVPPAGMTGEVTVVGMLTAENHPVEQRARVRLP